MKRIGIIGVLMIMFVVTACGKSGTMDHSGHNAEMEHGEEGMAQEADKGTAEKINAVFKLSTDQPKPNQDTTITINVQDQDGKPIEQFDINHEMKMHIIVVSKDLSFFNHIHPEDIGNGQFAVTTQFPTAGEYEIISDFVPTGIGAMTKKQWITVQGTAPSPQPIQPEAKLTKTIEGKEVTLSFDHLMANMEIKMTFNIKDAASGQPVKNLQPYLGAVGHVVILDETAEEYLHVHPMDEKASGPDANFMATLPHSGTFKIWGQFQHEDKVFIVPFVVEVP